MAIAMSDDTRHDLVLTDYVPQLAVSPEEALERFNRLKELQRQVLEPDVDYATLPGARKPSLHKPGAEKLLQFHGLSHRFVRVTAEERWDSTPPFFRYDYGCLVFKATPLPSGEVYEHPIAYREGTCNSLEAQYRWRWVPRREVPTDLDPEQLVSRKKRSRYGEYLVYRIPNDDVASLANTIMQQAQKRAMVQATLAATAASGLFTDELEELDAEGHLEPDAEGEQRPRRPRRRRRTERKAEPTPAGQENPSPAKHADQPTNRVELMRQLGTEIKRLGLSSEQASALSASLFAGAKSARDLRDDQVAALTDILADVPNGTPDVLRYVFRGLDEEGREE
jgi:hypothetical protein